jgi:hypothetical protein
MLNRSLAGAVALVTLSFVPGLHAQVCPGDAGNVLHVSPTNVPIGTSFDVSITAPVGNLVVLLVSTSPGPTPSPYGSLCVGLPAGTFAFVQQIPTITFPHPIECIPEYVGLTGYLQFVSANPLVGVSSVQKSNSVEIHLINGSCGNDSIEPGDFVTYTKGGWGTKCSGNNPGCTRDKYFASVFPNGLVFGDPDGIDGDSAFAALFTSSAAIDAYLPAGKTPKALDKNATNPTATAAGVFGGQLTAAKLNVAFDQAGVFDAVKPNDALKLGDLVFIANVHSKLIGLSVSEVILLSDNAISGAVAMPLDVDNDGIGDVGFADLSNALDKLNNEFDNGTQALGSLGIGSGP